MDKPVGPTSMQMVRVVRRAAGHCKTGHAGTLDPLASGLLVVCLGRATKAVERLMGMRKVYEARVDLSGWSATDDAEGPIEPVRVDEPPSGERVRAVLAGLTGVVMQRPPAHSAVKVGGKRAYALARKGKPPEMKERPVRIDGIEVVSYRYPELEIVVRCGKGTYIRSLARQIGEGLGTGGYLRGLRRTAIGVYEVSDAVGPEGLPERIEQEHLRAEPGEV